MDLRRQGRAAGRLWAHRALRLRHVHAAVGNSHCREVAARRQMEGRGHPGLEPRLFPFLARENTHPERTGRVVRRQPDLQLLSPALGRSHRRQRRAAVAARARLHRSHLRRRGDDSSPRHCGARLQGAREHHLYRPHRHRCPRLHRRRQRPRYQYERRGWRAARSRIVSARGPAHPCRPALSRLARAGDDIELLSGRDASLYGPAPDALLGISGRIVLRPCAAAIDPCRLRASAGDARLDEPLCAVPVRSRDRGRRSGARDDTRRHRFVHASCSCSG